MKYAPSNNELDSFSTMTEEERFIYCLTRIVEAEEIWGLAEAQGWVMSEHNEQTTLPIWPYKIFAEKSQHEEWKDALPQAISLEHFVYKISQLLIKNNIFVEVGPTAGKAGKIMPPNAFFKVLENLMESGEYFMEG